MFSRHSVMGMVFGLLLATTSQAHGPIPVPMEVVNDMLAATDDDFARYQHVYGVDPEQLYKILADEAAPTSQKVRALIILAEKPEPGASKWYEHYKDHTADLSLRYAVLYLGAMLGQLETRAAIIELLKTRPEKSSKLFAQEARLLRGLVELTSADEFTRLTDELYKPKDRFFPHDKLQQVKLQSALYKGNAEQRADAAYQLLTKWGEAPVLTEASLRYMIQLNDASPYLTSWRFQHPVLLYFLNRLGYTIQHQQGKAAFVKVADTHVNQPPSPDTLAKNIIAALTSNQQSALQQLLITPEAFKLLASLDKSNSLGKDQDVSQRHKQILDSWQRLQRSAAKRGIDLSQAQYKAATYRVMVMIGGMQLTGMDITLRDANQEHHLVLKISVLVDGQWQIVGPLDWL